MSRALLLIGSPRMKGSNSAPIGDYFLERLKTPDMSTETLRLALLSGSPDDKMRLLEAVRNSDLIILSFPLYYDGPPALVIRTMEWILAAEIPDMGKKRLLAICQNGFPEASQNQTALDICRQFARETGMQWAGGLAFGMGGVVDGKPLARRERMLRNLRKALDLSADALAQGRSIPEEAVTLAAQPVMPHWFYVWMGNWGWKRAAKKHGTRHLLDRTPYLPPED